MSIKTTQAYEASDGSIHKTPDDWAIHELATLLNLCSFNFDKEVAKEVLIRGDKLTEIIQMHKTHLDYYDKVVPGLLRPERTLVKDQGPKVDTTVIPPDQGKAEGVGVTTSPNPEWRNKSRDHPSQAPFDQPVGVGTGMKLGGALDDVAF